MYVKTNICPLINCGELISFDQQVVQLVAVQYCSLAGELCE